METKEGERGEGEAKEEERGETEGSVVEVEEDEKEGPPPGWESNHTCLLPSPTTTPIFLESSPPSPLSNHQDHNKVSSPPQPTPIPSSEMAQMVCGSCRCLLSYPKGSRHVQCASCQMANFVLEAHELGIVKCHSCAVLLMYPHAASSVQCASCRFVTEIGEHNKRPPWSVQQGN